MHTSPAVHLYGINFTSNFHLHYIQMKILVHFFVLVVISAGFTDTKTSLLSWIFSWIQVGFSWIHLDQSCLYNWKTPSLRLLVRRIIFSYPNKCEF